MTETRRRGARALPPATRMFHLALDSPATRAIHVAARLGLADRLDEGAQSAEGLAAATGAHAPSLRRLLRALASAGVFAEDPAGRFRLLPTGAALRADAPGSVRQAALMTPHAPGEQPWADLYESVMTGAPAFERAHGAPFFSFLARHPEAAAAFDAGMSRASRAHAAALLARCDLSGFRRVVDVGGGQGLFLAELLAAHPALLGVLFDRPEVARGARLPSEQDVAGRCEVVGGDFFEGVPPGGDLYLLKAILHDWPDEAAARILRRCREALAGVPTGRLLVFEMLLPPHPCPHPAWFMDLHLMALTGGRERTRADFRALCREAGFRLRCVVSAGAPFSLLEAAPYRRRPRAARRQAV